MRGLLIVRLQEYIQSKYGKNAWQLILESIQIPTSKLYFSQSSYPDEEFYKIITEAIKLSGGAANEFFEEFGNSLGPTFMSTLKPMIKPSWKAMDVLERIQDFNYHMLQQGEDPINMGKFEAKRLTQDTLQLEYTSPRQLCHLAIGLFKAIANLMGEELTITQSACMLYNSDKCVFDIKSRPLTKSGST